MRRGRGHRWRRLDVQVADVERRRVGEGIGGGFGCVISVVVSVASALVLETRE